MKRDEWANKVERIEERKKERKGTLSNVKSGGEEGKRGI